MIGICLAAMYPDAVEKLVIWGANSFVAEEDVKLYRQNRDLQGERLERLEARYGRECAFDYWGQWIDTHLKIYDAGGNICKDKLSSVKCPTFIIHARAAEAIFDRSGHNQICHPCLCGASTHIVCKAHVHANSRGVWGHAPQKIFKNYTL